MKKPLIKPIKLVFLVVLCLPALSLAKSNNDQIKSLPGLGKLDNTQYAGYSNNIYYWYSESKDNPDKKPIIIWTSGGPGTSSLYGMFKENGPYTCHINDNNEPIFEKAKDHSSWTNFSNYLVFDQPLGIGLSFANKSYWPSSPDQGNKQYHNALISFFNKHPELKKHDIYLAGESYGGTYIALLAKSILEKKSGLKLKGLIIISGWIDPKLQYKSMPKYAYNNGLIDSVQMNKSISLYKKCKKCDNSKKDCNQVCSNLDSYISKKSGLNMHNIADVAPDNWQSGGWVNCLNNDLVRKSINAKTQHTYKPMTNIWDLYERKQLISVLPIYKMLVKRNMKMLFISGLNDGSPCGVEGTKSVINKLGPSNKKMQQTQWTNDDLTLGYKVKLSPELMWLKVRNAGHTVPTQQPLISNVIKKFVQ